MAADYAQQYGPHELARIGRALYGPRWQTDIARALGLRDARRVRQWMCSERPIPPGVWVDLAALLRDRQQTVGTLLAGLEGLIAPDCM